MPKKTLLVANPYDDIQLETIRKFELENGLGESLTSRLKEISLRYSKEEYEKTLLLANEIEEYLFLCEDDKIIDCCLLNAYRDIKSCYLTLAPSKKMSTSKAMLSLVTPHAFNLGMLEIFATTNNYDKVLHEALELDGYENLGEENGVTSFVRSFEKEVVLNGNNKRT